MGGKQESWGMVGRLVFFVYWGPMGAGVPVMVVWFSFFLTLTFGGW